jgi:Na+-transporting NADH:ubiquinone oxidoreductase subunit NqrB
MKIVLSVLMIGALIASIISLIYKRKKAGITGVKTALTSICFYLIAITNLVAYWFDAIGLYSWMITVFLLVLGIYFMKYMVVPQKKG